MQEILKIENLSKTYKYSHLFNFSTYQALDKINITINRNEIFSLIGLNGSGKTTTIKLLLGLIRADSGTFSIFNSPEVSNHTKKKIGYLPEIPYFNKKFTPREMLTFWGSLSNLDKKFIKKKIVEVLRYTSLEHVIDTKIKGFSRGMLQRLGLSQALLSEPELLILDEPMGGLDPKGIIDIRELMLKLKEDGKTIFFSSHIISEVQKLADRVGILHKGRILDTIKPCADLEKEFLNIIEVKTEDA